ncbi:transposase family protein [Streptomyces sp. 4N124]|uniref:transposase family protein n=1 Tax=Streptomyces sp. 4N124 TaxID=3457420 RepID=UPI003FD2FCD6
MAPLMTCWPAGSASTAPPSQAPSAKCGRCWRNEAAPSHRASGCAPSSRSSSTWAPTVGTGIIDGTEIRVRRPAAGRKDRDKFVSGKAKKNAVKSMVLTDAEGRVLFCSPVRPGSCADITQARQLGLDKLLPRRSVHGDPR